MLSPRLSLQLPLQSLGRSSWLRGFSDFCKPHIKYEEVDDNIGEASIGMTDADFRTTYSSYSFPQLFLMNTILKACQKSWWIKSVAPSYSNFSLAHPALFYLPNQFIKATFFKQFCGGENTNEVASVIKSLKSRNVGSILDPAMEEDLAELGLPKSKENSGLNILPDLLTSGSSIYRPEIMKKRLYIIKQCIETSSRSSSASSAEPPFVAVKITCLMPTGILYSISQCLDFLINGLDPSKSGLVSRDIWSSYVKILKTNAPKDCSPFLDALEEKGLELFSNTTPLVYARQLVFSLSPNEILRFYCTVFLPIHGFSTPLDDVFRTLANDVNESLKITDEIVSFAKSKNVSLMIDAEQTYFQSAIHYFTKEIVSRSESLNNREYPLVFNTYQMYLRDGLYQLKSDVLAAKQENVPFGVKLVRGAYMMSERERAESINLPSPINDTIEDTHASYYSALDFLLSEALGRQREPATTKKLSLFVASHNHLTLEKTLKIVTAFENKEGGTSSGCSKSCVMFGQLLGMADHLTFSLARLGYRAYKYVPVGSVQEVLPYLIRRAQENSSILGRAGEEARQVNRALRSRFGC